MNYRKTIIGVAAIILITSAGAQLQFKTDNPVDYFSSIDMNNNQLSNLSDPVNGGDAIPLDYIQGQFLERDGDTMEGTLYLNGDPGNNTLVSYGSILSRGGAGALKLKANTEANHTYLELFTDNSSIDTRSAWIGFGNDKVKNLSITNEIGDWIKLRRANVQISNGNLDMNGNAITNIDWSASDNPATNLEALSTGTGLSGTSYNGSSSSTWSVNWGNANDLDNNGNLNPSSNLNMNGNNINNIGEVKTSIGWKFAGDTECGSSTNYALQRIELFDRNGYDGNIKKEYRVYVAADDNHGSTGEYSIFVTQHSGESRLSNVIMTHISGRPGLLEVQSNGTEIWINPTGKWGGVYYRTASAEYTGGTTPLNTRCSDPSGMDFKKNGPFDYDWDSSTLREYPKTGSNGNLDMNNNQVENVGTPDQSSDAATKGYVDSKSSGSLEITGTYYDSSKSCSSSYSGTSASASATATCQDSDAFIIAQGSTADVYTSSTNYVSCPFNANAHRSNIDTNWENRPSSSSHSISRSASGDNVEIEVISKVVCGKYN